MGTGYMASFSEDKFWNGAAGDNQLTLFLAVGLGNEMKLKLRLLSLKKKNCLGHSVFDVCVIVYTFSFLSFS